MSTYRDIRTQFQIALTKQYNAINENNKTIEGALLNSLAKILGDGRINNKHGNKDIRFDLGGNERRARRNIEKAFKKLKIKDINIEVAAPQDYMQGASSGKFFTYIITINEPITIDRKDFITGTQLKIVDNNPPKGSIKSKELTPSSLNLPEDVTMQLADLNKVVIQQINRKYKKNAFMQSFLTDLYTLIAQYTPTNKFNSLLALDAFKEAISYGDNIKEGIQALGATDLNTIGKDFGEILGAALMLKMLPTQEGIHFPAGNNPLVDFYIDGYGISSKYKAGAAPTLSNIIKNLDAQNFTQPEEQQLYQLFKIVLDNKVVDSYLQGAQFMQLSAAQKLTELTGIKKLTQATLEDFTQNKIETIGREAFFEQYVLPLAQITQRGHTKSIQVPWDKLENNQKYVGLLSYPISLQLIDKLNGKLGDGDLYIKTLKKIVGKLEIKQLYMDVDLKEDDILFYLKGFNDIDADIKFKAPNVSTPNPGNGKLGFKMK